MACRVYGARGGGGGGGGDGEGAKEGEGGAEERGSGREREESLIKPVVHVRHQGHNEPPLQGQPLYKGHCNPLPL